MFAVCDLFERAVNNQNLVKNTKRKISLHKTTNHGWTNSGGLLTSKIREKKIKYQKLFAECIISWNRNWTIEHPDYANHCFIYHKQFNYTTVNFFFRKCAFTNEPDKCILLHN